MVSPVIRMKRSMNLRVPQQLQLRPSLGISFLQALPRRNGLNRETKVQSGLAAGHQTERITNSDRDGNSMLDITLVSANVTRWSSAKGVLEKQTADIILLQEIKRVGDDVFQAQTFFAQLGYYSGVAESIVMGSVLELLFCGRDGSTFLQPLKFR